MNAGSSGGADRPHNTAEERRSERHFDDRELLPRGESPLRATKLDGSHLSTEQNNIGVEDQGIIGSRPPEW